MPDQAPNDAARIVYVWQSTGVPLREHEHRTAEFYAKWIAAILDCPFGGTIEAAQASGNPEGKLRYLVPVDTLIGDCGLAIKSEQEFFGGMVREPFMATKAITHDLVEAATAAPKGWNPAFARKVSEVVLPGFTAFSMEDALRAGKGMLCEGAVRLKPVCARGGLGQLIVETDQQLIDAIPNCSCEMGVVIERNLSKVKTWSVGTARIGDISISYLGIQNEIATASGQLVYGGSRLSCVRGDLSALLGSRASNEERRVVQMAMTYDSAADECLEGFIASRRNYDVAAGETSDGGKFCGVLEQSWRCGGASGAELAAIEFFNSNPSALSVETETVERYGGHTAPSDARIVFEGVIENGEQLIKYTRVLAHADE